MDKNYSSIFGPLRPKGLEVTPAEKTEWTRRFKQSGLSLREFSTAHGLRLASLRDWSFKFPPARARRGGAPPQSNCAQPKADFMEVRVPVGLRAPGWSVELALGNGKVLRLNGEVPERLVEQLLRLC